LIGGAELHISSVRDDLSALQVKAILELTASKDLSCAPYVSGKHNLYAQYDFGPVAPYDSGGFGLDGWSPWFGYGAVDAYKAVTLALADSHR
jgi:hypothetical protein